MTTISRLGLSLREFRMVVRTVSPPPLPEEPEEPEDGQLTDADLNSLSNTDATLLTMDVT